MAKRNDKNRSEPEQREDDSESPADEAGANKRNSPVLWVALGCGGLLVLTLCCAGVGAGAYFAFPTGLTGPAIVGKWERPFPQGFRQVEVWEFNRGGTGAIHIKNIPDAEVKAMDVTADFEYKVKSVDAEMLLELTIIRANDPERFKGLRTFFHLGQTETFRMKLDGDLLSLTTRGQANPAVYTLKRKL
jgi:hypothetical protein